MRRALSRLGVLTILMSSFVLRAPIVSAQVAQLSGKVLDLQGNPYPDVVVTIANKDTGQSYTVKTGKDGKYLQIGLTPGIYTVTFKKDNIDYGVQLKIGSGDNALDENFKEIAAKTGYDAEAEKKKEEAENKFKNLKLHFDNGKTAMDDAEALRQQLRTVASDQKPALQAKLTSDYDTAISEFQQAQAAAGATDPNLPTILGNLGLAYDGAGQLSGDMMRTTSGDQRQALQDKTDAYFQGAVTAMQKAAELKPTPSAYMQLGTDLAYAGKIPDASAACDKAAALDASNSSFAASCYRNIGIVLSKQNKLGDAVVPLQKATQLNPKDADAWFLLGSALTNQITTKTEGSEEIYVIPTGTVEAYQKYLDLTPTGPHAADAKASLDFLASVSGGVSTKVVTKKKKD